MESAHAENEGKITLESAKAFEADHFDTYLGKDFPEDGRSAATMKTIPSFSGEGIRSTLQGRLMLKRSIPQWLKR